MQRGYPCAAQGCESKGPFSFAKENGPFGTPRERLGLAVSSLNILYASGMGIPARGVAAVSVAIRFVSASIIRCRSASLVEVQPNFRLPPVSSMRRAQQCRARRQSAAGPPSLAPHDSKARLQAVTTRRDSWRSHVHRTYIAQRVQLFKIETANVRGRGGRPLVLSLGGLKGGYSLSEKENIPL